MPKDIRSYFSVIPKKTQATPVNKKPIIVSDSDEDVIPETPVKEPPRPKAQNLKPVKIDDVFGDKPVTQSKVHVVPSERKEERIQKKKKGKKKINKREMEVHDDEDFRRTLEQLDEGDDIIFDNLDVLDKTIEEATVIRKKGDDNKMEPIPKPGSSNGKPNPEMDVHHDEAFKKTLSEIDEDDTIDYASISDDDNRGNSVKRQGKVLKGSTPKKKKKLEHTDSGIDPGQEAYEKKRYSAMLYQKYKNRSGPKHHGEKEIPKGKPDCLSNLTFIRTGVLDSLDSEEFETLINRHGGRVVRSISRKTNYVVVGDEPGPAKLAKAADLNIPQIDEDELLDMILTKSGMKPRFSKHDSTESGIAITSKRRMSESDEETKPKQKKSKSEEKKATSRLSEKILKNKKEVSEESHIEDLLPKPDQKKGPNQKKEMESKNEEPIKRTIQSSSVLYDIWTEKYKPKELKNVLGQQGAGSNLNKLLNWLSNWHDNQVRVALKKISKPSPWAKSNDGAYFKAALLSGPPGVGKTTTATLVSKQLGLDIVEFNASDTRSKKLLHEEVSQILNTTSLVAFASGMSLTKKRVLLMDEVDGMAGNEDRGGMNELINLIKNTNVPIICMCNDRNHQKMRSLVNYCYDLKFNPPKMEQIKGAMMSICYKENVSISPKALTEIITGSGCDVRQTLNHLSMWTISDGNFKAEDASKESRTTKKDTTMGPWEVIRKVFSESEKGTMSLADQSRLFFYDYSLGPLFVQENYIRVKPKCPRQDTLKRLAQAADSISRGDLVDSKIRSSNNWALLETQAYFSSVLPGYYMSGEFDAQINFPGWLGKNSTANKRGRMLVELSSRTRTSISGGKLAMTLDYGVPLRDAIISPLRKYGVEGVPRAIEVMKSYNLLREDLDYLLELCQWSDTENPFLAVESKVKSAFTRAYNKEVQLSSGASIIKKKVSKKEDDDEDSEGNEEEEDDDLTTNPMIKVRSGKKDVKAKKETLKQKKETTTKRGGKAKK